MNRHQRRRRPGARPIRQPIAKARRWLRERSGGLTGGRIGGDAGQVTPFAVLMTIALFAVAGLVLDAGLALAEKVRALDVAQAAARAGAQELDLYKYRTANVAELDPARAASAARAWLASAGVEGEATATTTTVTVTVRRTTSTQLLQIVGVGELHVSASASATAVQGVTGPNT